MGLLLVLICGPALICLIELIAFLITGKPWMHRIFIGLAELAGLIILPLMYAGFGDDNDCCNDSTAFSPKHQLSIGILCILCLAAYFYSAYRTKLAPPVVEVLVNTLLVMGIVLNIFIVFHVTDPGLAVLGNGPIITLAVFALIKNQRLFMKQAQQRAGNYSNAAERIAFNILNLAPLAKIPVLFVLCLPVLLIITSILLLFGQKPDSIIRAFTETYKHGFSQWDYKCDNVECGGHYLCSVAANGHKKIVQPQRMGIRNGNGIICNRQLLVSNAFEELLAEKLPALHGHIRTNYNKVGNFIHRYYGIFNNKLVSDAVYILMKPAEWIFLLLLYSFDRNPENRIAKQYLATAHKKMMDIQTL
jgi:hypothetical protein